MSKLKFGWSEVDITPEKKIALCGEFFERVTNEVETPISVTALAISNGIDQAVMVSCDLVGIGEYLMEKVREKITNPNVDRAKIIIACVHTHNSYTYTGKKPGSENAGNSLGVIKSLMPKACKYIEQAESADALNPDLALEFLSDKIALAIDTAWANLAEGGYKATFGRVAVGMNRRVCYSDNTAKMWGDVDRATFTGLEAGNDNGMEMLFIYDKDGKMTGIVANVACPAQVMEQRSVISSDFWGKVKILLRQKFGKDLNLLALVSPAGDLCPRDLIRWVEPETPILDPNVIRNNPKKRNADPSTFDIKGSWLIAKRIVNEMELIMDESEADEIVTSAVLAHSCLNLKLPLRRVTEAERITAEKSIQEFFKDKTEIDYMDTAELHVHAGTIIRYDYQNTHNLVPTEVHVVRLGSVAFATNPFELFHDYGNLIRARSDAEQTFMAQLCCGDSGYLPTKKAEDGGHYSAYISSGNVGHVGGDMLVRATLEEIKKLFNN